MTFDEHVEVLRGLARGERDRWIADAQQFADEAGAIGYVERQRRWLAEVERLKAMRFPGEQPSAA
jgi:hypothetical protein